MAGFDELLTDRRLTRARVESHLMASLVVAGRVEWPSCAPPFRLKKHTVSAEVSVVTGFFAGCARRAMIVERFQYAEEKHV